METLIQKLQDSHSIQKYKMSVQVNILIQSDKE